MLLDDEQGLAAGLIDKAGGRSREALRQVELALAEAAEGAGLGRGPALSRADHGARLRQCREDRAEGGRFLRHRRAPAARARDGEGRGRRPRSSPTPACPPRRSTPRSTTCARAAPPNSASAENAYDALKKYARDLTEAARDRQARSGHRPRRGNPPHHPGAVAPHQEQSGADRRAGRRQDRDRRGPGAAHRQRRRAGIAEGQEAAGARHGRADRRREISRRVRGAAEGGAQRGDRRRGRRHPVHRRDAHAGRRRQGGRRDGRLQPA